MVRSSVVHVKQNALQVKQNGRRAPRASNDRLALHFYAYGSICAFPGESEQRFSPELLAVKWRCCVRSGRVCKSFSRHSVPLLLTLFLKHSPNADLTLLVIHMHFFFLYTVYQLQQQAPRPKRITCPQEVSISA